MTAHVGEVTSVEFDHEGKYLLAGCKDNSNRLWDLRMVGYTQNNLTAATKHLPVHWPPEHVQEHYPVLVCLAFQQPHCWRVRGRTGVPLGTRGRRRG